MNLKDLKKEISFKWKIQTKPKPDKKGCCVAYIDSRDVQDILDEVCSPENWQSVFYEVKGKVFCKIGIKIWDEWVWKSDSWALDESENVESETTSKWETSDAFKRAGVQWGIGRFLYEKEMVWITEAEYNAYKYKITEFCNSRGNYKREVVQSATPQKNVFESASEWDDTVSIPEKNPKRQCTKCKAMVDARIFKDKYGKNSFKCPACKEYNNNVQ